MVPTVLTLEDSASQKSRASIPCSLDRDVVARFKFEVGGCLVYAVWKALAIKLQIQLSCLLFSFHPRKLVRFDSMVEFVEDRGAHRSSFNWSPDTIVASLDRAEIGSLGSSGNTMHCVRMCICSLSPQAPLGRGLIGTLYSMGIANGFSNLLSSRSS